MPQTQEAVAAPKTKTTKATKATKTSAPVSMLPKVRSVIDDLSSVFLEREAIIRGIFCAMLVREHAYLVGVPGTGKSALTRAIASAMGASYFEWLMSKFTTPEEILGPVSLAGLKKDRMTRVYKGKLPDAQLVFLDEIFKSNSACLNAILAAINERVFHDDGVPKPIPLRTCIGASNELPEHVELQALNDRFLMRFIVDDLATPAAWKAVVVATAEPSIGSSLTIAEFDAAIAEVEQVVVTDDVVTGLWQLRESLTREGIRVSTRRWKKLTKILRAAAWLDGSPEVDSMHFEILEHGLWQDPSQREKIKMLVSKVVSPALAEANEIYGSIMELIASLPADDHLGSSGGTTIGELKKASEKLKKLATDSPPALARKIDELKADLGKQHILLRERMMSEMNL